MKINMIIVVILLYLTILASPCAYAGNRTYILEGLGIGTGIGIASGAAIGGFVGLGACHLAEENKNSCYWQAPLIGMIPLGVTGAIVGTILGATKPKPEPDKVALLPEIWFNSNQELTTGLRIDW